MKKSIMVVGCHADDVEFRAGGTLAKYIDMGYKGYYVQLTNSNSGYNCLKPGAGYDYSEKISAMRLQEAAAAADVFGAEPIFMNFKEHLYTMEDGSQIYADIRSFPELEGKTVTGREPVVVACRIQKYLDEFTEKVIEAEPEIVIAHQLDPNPDHYAAFLMTFQAMRTASQKIEVGNLYIRTTSYTYESFFGIKPDFFVDVSGYEETVFKAINKHVTQVKSSPREEKMKIQWRLHADKVTGAEFVEAFKKISYSNPGL